MPGESRDSKVDRMFKQRKYETSCIDPIQYTVLVRYAGSFSIVATQSAMLRSRMGLQ